MGGATNPRLTWRMAAIYAAQIVVSAVILMLAYRLVSAPEVQWAVITVAVVLQPGLKDSKVASLSRVVANVVGAAVGLSITLLLGDSPWQFLLALVVVVFLCQGLGLDQSLRSACVAVTIVMISSGGHVVASALERTGSVIAGSAVALGVQYATHFLHARTNGPGD